MLTGSMREFEWRFLVAKQLKVTFLGGVGEIGKNMTAIEYGDNVIIIDCGSAFPNNETPGIDLVIPDFNYLADKADKVRAILLTHGHEDHIGGMPYLLKIMPNVKVYGTKLTLALLEHKLGENNILSSKTVCVNDGDKERIGCFDVEFVRQSHSISGALALAITTPLGLIFHTGDYKIDYTPIDGMSANLNKFAEIGDRGVMLMLGESTNVEKPGYSISESMVGATFDKLFANNDLSRLIIATFASNVHRIQQILNMCEKYGRKVVFNGRSMRRISELATAIGELKIKPEMIIEPEDISKYPDKKLCIISTGSQGEPMSALSRMASGEDKITVGTNDVVILSSSPIPGNEKYVYNVINNLYRRGARVIYGSLNELHVSGHACQEELKLMLSLIKPKFFIPVHGEYRHLKQHQEMAERMGVLSKNSLIADIGSQIEVKKTKLTKLENVKAGNIYVDGLMDVDTLVLRDRTQLSQDGFVVVLIGLSVEDQSIANTPDIIARGLQCSDELIEEMRATIHSVADHFNYRGVEDRANFKAKVRRQLNNLIKIRLKQKPMILPIIMEI